MANINFMQRLSQTLTKIGTGFTQTAMTSIAFNSMNHCCCNNSIFGPRFGGGFGIPAQMAADPMGFTWLRNPMNMANAQNTAYGNMIAAQYGAYLGAQVRATASNSQFPQFPQFNQLQQAPKTNAKYAGDLDENQETESGKAFDEATNEMSEGENAKDYNIIDKYTDPDDKTKCAEEYRNSVSNLAKSYAANIDKSSGNSDNKVTSDEFINHELSKLDPNANAQVKAQAKQMALNAFNKIDQNGDGYADWKELAATIATFDTDPTNGKTSKDGTITSKDYNQWSTLLSQQNANKFDTTVRNSYKQLFDQ